MTPTDQLRAMSEDHSAHNYHPLPIVVSEADGVWLTDAMAAVDGRRLAEVRVPQAGLRTSVRRPFLLLHLLRLDELSS